VALQPFRLWLPKLGPAPTGPPFRQQNDNPEEEPPGEYGNDVVDGMFDLLAQGQQRTQTRDSNSRHAWPHAGKTKIKNFS
jgi:hypothetical protein